MVAISTALAKPRRESAMSGGWVSLDGNDGAAGKDAQRVINLKLVRAMRARRKALARGISREELPLLPLLACAEQPWRPPVRAAAVQAKWDQRRMERATAPAVGLTRRGARL